MEDFVVNDFADGIDHPRLTPVWEALEELAVPIFWCESAACGTASPPFIC